MRIGRGSAVQQTLTAEAASVLKQSLTLARRRGHAQVTPLHVAAILLTSKSSLLRTACLKSQPHQSTHPLHSRALELCFNVALNKLPTAPGLGLHLHVQPSLSNALIAALKRAQAHQRRGFLDQQQQEQHLVPLKVDLEQLIVSILDDPTVSRVMREAGYSSPAVKDNVEDYSNFSVFQWYGDETQRELINPSTFWQTRFLAYPCDPTPLLFSPQNRSSLKEDIKLVLDVMLMKKRRNVIIVGDNMLITEGLVRELMEKTERGEFPHNLKQTCFINFQFSHGDLRFMKRADVEMNLLELRKKVVYCLSGGEGAIIYVGDLKWAFKGDEVEACGYSQVEHLVAELGLLLSEYNYSHSKVWLLGTASYQTYMRCKMKHPYLENQWDFQAVSVPSGRHGLSLHAPSVGDSRNSSELETKRFVLKEEHDELNCCHKCTSNHEKEAQFLKSGDQKPLPSWLQQKGLDIPKKDDFAGLARKWNRLLCHTPNQGRQDQNHSHSALNKSPSSTDKNYFYASSYPCWPSQSTTSPNLNSISLTNSAIGTTTSPNSSPQQRLQNSCKTDLSLISLKKTEGKEENITLSLGNSLFGDSGESTESKCEITVHHAYLFKQLQESVPWQSRRIPSIVNTLIDCKSASKDTWLLIQGNDLLGKRRLAQAIGKSIIWCADLVLHMNMRDEVNPCLEILVKALGNHKKLVVLVEDVDLADAQFMKFLADRFENTHFGECSKRDENIGKVIFILTRGGSMNFEHKKHRQDLVMEMTLKGSNYVSPSSGTYKRKAEWEYSNHKKCTKMCENEDCCLGTIENRGMQKELARETSISSFDLNIGAYEDDDIEEEPEEISPVSSDLTRESTPDSVCASGFLGSIKNSFTLNRSSI